jgi:hypothetical protein
MRAISAAAIWACCGCGGNPTLSLRTNLESALDQCNNNDTLASEMEATLDISGHEQCQLSVAQGLEVQGDCEVTIGAVRFLGLAYHWQDMMLAYVIGWVDLRKDALGEGATELDVALGGDDRSTQVDTNDELDQLSADTAECSEAEGAAGNLCNAGAWAKNLLASVDFDVDNDGDSNLTDACTGH